MRSQERQEIQSFVDSLLPVRISIDDLPFVTLIAHFAQGYGGAHQVSCCFLPVLPVLWIKNIAEMHIALSGASLIHKSKIWNYYKPGVMPAHKVQEILEGYRVYPETYKDVQTSF